MVKSGCGQSGDGTLKLSVSQKLNRWNRLIFCMLVQIQENQKLIQLFLVGHGQKYQRSFSSWDPKIFCILRMNIWIELII